MNDNKPNFIDEFHQITLKDISNSNIINNRRFSSFFGVSVQTCNDLWGLCCNIQNINPLGLEGTYDLQPKYLLMALHFLKCYNTESVNALLFHVDEKTYRKWQWRMIEILTKLNMVKFENRFKGSPEGANSFVSLDGTDFQIEEPQLQPFSSKWFSHKFKGAGLRYEIGLGIYNGDIVWAYGGVPCGEYSDLKLARESYIYHTEEGELTIADNGYKDKNYFIYPKADQESIEIQRVIMARHETVNNRIKQFKCMYNVFRHRRSLHPLCFHAIVNIIQVGINNGERLYDIDF